MRFPVGALALASALVVTACGPKHGDGLRLPPTYETSAPSASSATSRRPAPSSTVTAATTVVPATATGVPTTLPATTGPATTVVTTTSAPPTTTVPAPTTPATITAVVETPARAEIEPTEQQVTEQFLALRALAEQCRFAPASCDPSGFAVPASPFEASVIALAEDLIGSGVHHVPVDGGDQLRVEAVTVEGTSAFVQACTTDSVVVAFGDDPSASTLPPILTSARSEWELRDTGGQLRIFDVQTLDSRRGSDLCAG